MKNIFAYICSITVLASSLYSSNYYAHDHEKVTSRTEGMDNICDPIKKAESKKALFMAALNPIQHEYDRINGLAVTDLQFPLNEVYEGYNTDVNKLLEGREVNTDDILDLLNKKILLIQKNIEFLDRYISRLTPPNLNLAKNFGRPGPAAQLSAPTE